MMEIGDYILIEKFELSQFQAEVKKYIHKGYELLGDPQINIIYEDYHFFNSVESSLDWGPQYVLDKMKSNFKMIYNQALIKKSKTN